MIRAVDAYLAENEPADTLMSDYLAITSDPSSDQLNDAISASVLEEYQRPRQRDLSYTLEPWQPVT